METHKPDTVFLQIDSSVYHSKLTKSVEELELYEKYGSGSKEDQEALAHSMIPNKYPNSVDDLFINYDKIDEHLKTIHDEQKRIFEDSDEGVQNSNIEDKHLFHGYHFDEVYYKTIKPQLLNKIEEYKEAFNAITTREDIRKHPKMQELKEIHDLIELSRQLICGPLIEHSHFDMYNHLLRSLINRNNVVLGDYPDVLYRKYLDSKLPLGKVEKYFNEIITRLKDPQYDEMRGKDHVS
jgi:hypothetical protein